MSRRKARRGRCFLPPDRSAAVYVAIAPHKVHMFRFFLEAQDNLGLMSVVDRWAAVLRVRFSPHQEKELRECLAAMRESLEFTVLLEPRPEQGSTG